ncbi:MAG: (Fe-S)-binding protein [Desulforhopalus sp.]|nr:(Fe-S)-binding protein [Desulforhopalus sp.]
MMSEAVVRKTPGRHKVLEDFADAIQRCVRCGACQAYCPAWSAGRREGNVARGKVAVAAAMLAGELGRGAELEPAARQDISLCLMCGSCTHGCPNDVPTAEIVGAIRREVAAETGLSAVGVGVAALLGSKTLMRGVVAAGAALAPVMMEKVPESSGLRLRFPLDRLPVVGERILPAPAGKNLFARLPERIEGQPGRPKVAFFAGCAITWLYPQIGEKMVEVLVRLGCTVYLPKGQGCCGMPALSSGDGPLVSRLASANVRAFMPLDVDYIITACASCGGGIGEYYLTMGGDPAILAKKVVDFTVFLEEEGVCERLAALPRAVKRQKVCWHDPCHLKNRGILAPPRHLLAALPGVDFVEMEGASRCCGLGGTFSVHHSEESGLIGEKKVEGVQACGAELVATACPGCVMQLETSLCRAELPVRAVHLLELFGEAEMAALADD